MIGELGHMAEPLFYKRPSGVTVAEIATLVKAEPGPGARLDHRITNVAPLDQAGPSDLTLFDNIKFSDALAATNAGACLIAERLADRVASCVPAHLTSLRTRDPYLAFVAVASALFPDALRPSSLFEATGISAGAIVHATARLENGVTIDPGAVIGPRAEIGAGTIVAPTAVIGPDVRIGRDCSIGAGVTILYALIGDRVIIHPGCRIGQDGFGFVPGPKGQNKIPQLGRVIIQNDVEIGANTAIDRGSIRDTVIGEGTKIDNLVQVGHNVSIGRHCVIAGQAGLAGSATLKDYAMLAGGVAVSDHITIGARARVGGRSGVMTDVPAGESWCGYPAVPVKEWLRSAVIVRKLARRAGGAKAGSSDE